MNHVTRHAFFPPLTPNIQEEIQKTMMSLASFCGYKSIAELHANEVSMMLTEFTESKVRHDVESISH